MKTKKLIRKVRKSELFEEFKEEDRVVFVRKGVWAEEYEKFLGEKEEEEE